ncbi:hypothetical protein GI364_23080 [Alicyclobacillus sp. SO9]|nr:hypothetical protein GI364_23080 [Alicyclobacillus sp. SO9]
MSPSNSSIEIAVTCVVQVGKEMPYDTNYQYKAGWVKPAGREGGAVVYLRDRHGVIDE